MSGVLRATILGCGSSLGVPRIDGSWGACDPNDPRNRRTRCGLLLQRWRGEDRNPNRATTVLIDTPPELRQQMLATRAARVDAVLYSHDHADQSHGIDDLRGYAQVQRQRIRVYMDEPTRASLTHRFAYCFEGWGGYPAILDDAGLLSPFEAVSIDGPGGALEILPLPQDHGEIASLGFRVGAFAYSNDVVRLSQNALDRLRDLDVWVVDALRRQPHPTHAHVAQALAWIEEIRPRRAVLTNLHVDLDYAELAASLPAGVEPAIDGLQFELSFP